MCTNPVLFANTISPLLCVTRPSFWLDISRWAQVTHFPEFHLFIHLVLFCFFFSVLKVVNRRVDRQAANQVQVKATKKTTFFHTLWLTLYTKHRGHTWFASISAHHIVLTQTWWSFSQRTLFKTDNFVLHAITANFCFFESFFFKMITKGYHRSFIDSSFKADGQWKWTG